ncbi:MAG: hypothetical protein OFPII_06650 [Osedax symbiont Rs1]|nr:MAG: hypothetical protein OFPII_06650 [Osedax symbiont Rs1]
MAKLAKYKEKLLNEFESRTDDWSFGDFERRITEIKSGAYYQDAKMAIIEGHRVGSWPNTVQRYLLTNHKAFGSVSIEFHDIFNQICTNLNTEEKKIWDIR